MTTTIDPTTTVGQLVTQRPSRSRVFERYHLDYCCHGGTPLQEACAAKGVDLNAVLQALSEAEAQATDDETDWTARSLTDLADHIEQTHHLYLRDELPRLRRMVDRVTEVHGERHTWLPELQSTFHALQDELQQHMMKEEQILFPICRQLDSASGPTAFHCGTVRNPIAQMEHEHDNAGRALEAMRELSSGYTPPEDACNTFRALLDGLRELELDLHQHIHKENNILFPRAVEAEAAR